jgi:PAS domain S-box-containing protein
LTVRGHPTYLLLKGNNLRNRFTFSAGFIVLALFLSTILRLGLNPVLGQGVPFILYYPTVVLCAWYGGLRSGLLSTALAGLISWYLFIPPEKTFSISDPAASVQLVVFCLAGGLISALAESLHRARTRAEISESREQEERERFRVTLSSIGDGVIATDALGRVTFMNQVAEILTGWTYGEAAGKPLDEVFRIVNEQTRQTVENPVSQAMREGQIVGLANDTMLTDRNGAEKAIDDCAAPIKDAGGRTAGAVLIFRDVSERRQVEHDRTRLLQTAEMERAEAESASHAKDEFLAMVSHELRTPLNAILGWASLLSRGRFSSEETQKAIDTIERNAKAQAQLIEDLLDVSRIMSGKLRVSFDHVNLADTVMPVLETIKPAAEAKMIELVTNMDTSLVVMGDAGRLRQIVWNLLSNAVKFTAKKGRVELRVERKGSEACLTVADTGKGMNRDFLPRAFERFQQADSTNTRQHGGLGLGLAIVRHLTEMHGGTVTADSPGPGRGSTFVVELPIAAVQTKPSVQTDARVLEAMPSLDGLRALVVDDDESSRDVVSAILRQCGISTTAVGSVADAIRILESDSFDVLVSDIAMPHEDGYELIGKVRKLRPERGGNIPAVALTAYARTQDRMRALAAGYQTHVAKPVKPTELALVVAAVVRHSAGEVRSY